MGRGAHQYTPEETLRLTRKGGMTNSKAGNRGDSNKINKVYELAYRTGQATQIRVDCVVCSPTLARALFSVVFRKQ